MFSENLYVQIDNPRPRDNPQKIIRQGYDKGLENKNSDTSINE